MRRSCVIVTALIAISSMASRDASSPVNTARQEGSDPERMGGAVAAEVLNAGLSVCVYGRPVASREGGPAQAVTSIRTDCVLDRSPRRHNGRHVARTA